MLYDWFLAWRNMRARPVQTLGTLLAVALAIALPILVFALGDGAREGIIRASDPFGVLVVGAKGSAQQLVLNTILLQGLPVGNIPYGIYEDLADDERVTLAVPIAKGDNVGGSRIIGTNAALLELRPTLNDPPAFRVGQGRFFEGDFEAVLGSRAAAELGLRLGDRFQGQHGVEVGLASDMHEEAYTVVGIFEPTNSPFDSAVYVSVESVWRVHEPDEDEVNAPNPFLVGDPAAASDQITAVLVKPVGFIEQNQLWQAFQASTEAQAAFPGQELGGLFDLFAQGERILTAVGYLVLFIAGLTVFLSMHGAIAAREQGIAVMRSLGSSRLNVFRVVLFETLLVMVIGALLGRVLGYALAFIVATVLSNNSAIPIPIRFLPSLEPLLWLLPLALGLLAGLLPAIQAYSVDVVEKLFPT